MFINIIEAVRSGKKFKKKAGTEWLMCGPCSMFIRNENGDYYHSTVDDILATDWEVEEKKVEITYEQLRDAYNKHLKVTIIPGCSVAFGPMGSTVEERPRLNELAKELGLSE